MKSLILISCIFISAIFSACQYDETIYKRDLNSSNSEILSLVFDTLIGDEEDWKNLLLPVPYPLEHSSPDFLFDSLKQQQLIDSVKFELNNKEFTVFVNDTFPIPDFKLDLIHSLSDLESFKSNFHHADTSNRHLLRKLTENYIFEPADISEIKTSRDYILKSLSSKENHLNHGVIIGYITFSEIMFNEDNTIACIYSELVCGSKCGEGNIYFLEKYSGNWKIISKNEIWIS